MTLIVGAEATPLLLVSKTDAHISQYENWLVAMSYCCDTQIHYSAEFDWYCPSCRNPLGVQPIDPRMHLSSRYILKKEDIAYPGSAKEWLRRWTGFSVEDITIEIRF
jgi:hypothetical protein